MRYAIAVACKSLNTEKMKKVIIFFSLYIHQNHLKTAIFLEPVCFQENGFYQGGENRVQHSALSSRKVHDDINFGFYFFIIHFWPLG